MIRVLLDTNVLASGFLGADLSLSVPGELIRQWRRGRYHLVTSHHLLAEFDRTMDSPWFRDHLSTERIMSAVTLLMHKSELAPITISVVGVASHPEDDLVLAAAVSGHVDYLVTGDRMLLKLGAYEGVRIVSPGAFLTALDQAATLPDE